MKLYLAGRYGRRVELAAVGVRLTAAGYRITSRWLDGSHDEMPDAAAAIADLADIEDADGVVSFTEAPGPTGGRARGGRHFEAGFGYHAGKVSIVVGPRENVFHFLPRVVQVDDVDALVAYLEAWRAGRSAGAVDWRAFAGTVRP